MSTSNTLNLALLTIGMLKKDFFMSAFAGRIVFGEIFKTKYKPKKHFMIYRCNYTHLFKEILNILKAIGQIKDATGVLLQNSHMKITWTVSSSVVTFLLKEPFEFKTQFDFEEFNNFLDCFNELIFSSLLIKKPEADLLDNISKLDIKNILEEKSFLKDAKLTHEQQIIINFNLDIIVLKHKFRKLIDLKYRASFDFFI